MAGPDEMPSSSPDPALPEDIPPEFAEAYRSAYAEALGVEGPESRSASAPRAQRAVAAHRRPPARSDMAPLWSLPWVKASIAASAAVVLVLGAYGIGRAFSSGPTSTARSASSSSSASASGGRAAAAPYRGPVRAVTPTSVTASCTAPPAVDAAGRPVDYRPRNMLDHDPSTAWRCDGSGVGVTLTFELPAGTKVVEVGLVPGYAKTDPVSGADRYAENNRITAVGWTIGDRRVVQHFSGDPHDRSLRTMRVPVTSAGSLRLQILASAHGPRDTVAISGIRVGTPRG